MPFVSGPRVHSEYSFCSAVIGCTAFDAGEDRAPFVCEFDIGVAEVQRGEGAVRALERAAANALRRDAS